jgi:hypothetical protein
MSLQSAILQHMQKKNIFDIFSQLIQKHDSIFLFLFQQHK